MKNMLNNTAVWHSPHLRGTLFLRADFKQHAFEPHFHDEYAIGVIDAGCQAFTYDKGRRFDMPCGSVALIAPGPHTRRNRMRRWRRAWAHRLGEPNRCSTRPSPTNQASVRGSIRMQRTALWSPWTPRPERSNCWISLSPRIAAR